MINRKDFIIGKEFWYVNFHLNGKFSNLFSEFTKVKLVLVGPFLKLKKINEKGITDYVPWSHYINYSLKDSKLNQLFYTEQEAIEYWNDEVDSYIRKLNILFDDRVDCQNYTFKEFLKFKDYIKNFKENIENINKEVSTLIKNNDIVNDEDIYYKINYSFSGCGSNDLCKYVSYFNFNILKLRERRENLYVFDTYRVNIDYSIFTLDGLIDYNRKNGLVYGSMLYKNNLKEHMISNNIYTGISNSLLIDIEGKYNSFLNNLNDCYNNINNYLLSLKK